VLKVHSFFAIIHLFWGGEQSTTKVCKKKLYVEKNERQRSKKTKEKPHKRKRMMHTKDLALVLYF